MEKNQVSKITVTSVVVNSQRVLISEEYIINNKKGFKNKIIVEFSPIFKLQINVTKKTDDTDSNMSASQDKDGSVRGELLSINIDHPVSSGESMSMDKPQSLFIRNVKYKVKDEDGNEKTHEKREQVFYFISIMDDGMSSSLKLKLLSEELN